MTYALFEDTGKLLTGRLMSETDSSVQIEMDSGKRVKAKAAHVLVRFDKPEPAVLIAASTALAAEIDLAMTWEFAPEDEFGFADLARDYFSAAATTTEQTAMLMALHAAPHYFRRGGQKGHFKKADAAVLALALAANLANDWPAAATSRPAASATRRTKSIWRPASSADP